MALRKNYPHNQPVGRVNIFDTRPVFKTLNPQRQHTGHADETHDAETASITLDSYRRFGLYVSVLRVMRLRGRTDISLDSMSQELAISRAVIEEDFLQFGLALAGQAAFNINMLTAEIENILGYRNETEAFLVGAGKLGTSLLLKENLGQTNLKIIAAFDNDYRKIGSLIGSIRVMSPDKIVPLAERMHVCLGIISTPKGEAQHIADILTGAGMKAIWNFTPDEIEVEPGIIVENTRLGQDLNVGYQNLIEKLRK
ncbi:MAG: redox-sensing transcriptional repressor Rex [Lentimicrobium sp.]|nr:redox-sensing transcriptional repressor Rex [Lentimicrobium sp.]HPG33528.1 redox-sensing transcriptional repressor Rex [Lentimicrobium sp.]